MFLYILVSENIISITGNCDFLKICRTYYLICALEITVYSVISWKEFKRITNIEYTPVYKNSEKAAFCKDNQLY